ncbi:MAG: hypothetical protein AAGC86_04200 [Pseudomonadota bacterium]
MRRNGWHIARQDGGVILSRRPGGRAAGSGLWAETRLPAGGRLSVLAHEIRKDLWRALRHVRGFSPIIEIHPCREEAGLCVRAGGATASPPPAPLQATLSAVLEDSARRARWISHAARRQK